MFTLVWFRPTDQVDLNRLGILGLLWSKLIEMSPIDSAVIRVSDLVDLVGQNALSRQPINFSPVMVETRLAISK